MALPGSANYLYFLITEDKSSDSLGLGLQLFFSFAMVLFGLNHYTNRYSAPNPINLCKFRFVPSVISAAQDDSVECIACSAGAGVIVAVSTADNVSAGRARPPSLYSHSLPFDSSRLLGLIPRTHHPNYLQILILTNTNTNTY